METKLRFYRLLLRRFYERQEERKELFNHLVSFVRDCIPLDRIIQEVGEVKDPYASYAKRIVAGKVDPPKEIPEELIEMVRDVIKAELACKAAIKRRVEKLPLWKEYLRYVKGVGQTLSFGIYTYLAPIDRFPHLSNLYSYVGLGVELMCKKCGKRAFDNPAKREEWINKVKQKLRIKNPEKYLCNCKEPELVWVAQRKRANWICTFNPKIKSFFRYRLGVLGLLMSKGWYYQQYKIFREEELKKAQTKKHALNRAERKMVKLFLGHLYIAWRLQEGLSVEPQYSAAHLGHKFIPPIVDDVPDENRPLVWCSEVTHYCDSCECRRICPKRIV